MSKVKVIGSVLGLLTHLGIYVLWEVVGQQVIVAACCDGGDHGLKEVIPAKLALFY